MESNKEFYDSLTEEKVFNFLYEINEDYFDVWYQEANNEIEKFDCIFYYDFLNFCGCGTPYKVKKVIRNYLRCLFDFGNKKENMMKYFGCESIYDNDLLLYMAYSLDAEGFTEHGSGIGGAWLTELGIVYLWILDRIDLEDD